MKAHVVEILFTRHCRHLCEAIERVRAATGAAEDVELRLVQVDDVRAARRGAAHPAWACTRECCVPTARAQVSPRITTPRRTISSATIESGF
jgi:hypothetical protein